MSKNLQEILAQMTANRGPIPESFMFGDGINWSSPLEDVTLYVELPFWLMTPAGPVVIEWSGAKFTVHVCPPWMEVFGWEVTDSRASVVHQGPLDPAYAPSEQIEEALEESGGALMVRRSKTVLRLQTRGHADAFRDVGDDEPPRVAEEHVVYWASLCEAHLPVINELIQRYRLASYDYFAYEVCPWDVPVWQLKHREEGVTAVLLTYKRWDEKPVILEDGKEPGDPPVARPFEFARADDLETLQSSAATPGEFDLLDARSLMERGDYTGAVRRTVTAIEAVLEWALSSELERKYGRNEAAQRLEASKNDFPGRVRQWLKLAEPSVDQDRFDKFEETREVRHEIVHKGRRLTQAERGMAQRLVDTGRWLYNEIEGKDERKQLREFAPGAVLRSVGRVEMSPRFPAEVDESGIVLRPFSVPEP
jgi:hypothetical protein